MKCPDCGEEMREWNGLDGPGWKCPAANCGLLWLLRWPL